MLSRTRALLGLLLSSLLLSSLALSGSQQRPRPPLPEASIKAAYLLRFADFVEWPAGDDHPFTVCLSRSHEFGTLVSTLAGQSQVRGRPVVVRTWSGAPADCKIAYLSPEDYGDLAPLAKVPLLTVGDAPGFCARGGIINFRTVEGKVRFEVGLGNARRAGLTIHSQLLSLATTVFEVPR